MKDWTTFSVTKQVDALRVLTDAGAWYGDGAVTKQLEEITVELREWLIQGRESTNQFGDVSRRDGPWFPKNLDATDDFARIDLRRSGLRKRLFEHGLRRMFNRMLDRDLLAPEAADLFRMATSFEMMALHEEMIGYKLSACLNTKIKTLTLNDIKKRFGLSDGTAPEKIRNRRLVIMSGLGVWDAKVSDGGEYQISSGAVAIIFHNKVFVPILQHFEQLLNGHQKQG